MGIAWILTSGGVGVRGRCHHAGDINFRTYTLLVHSEEQNTYPPPLTHPQDARHPKTRERNSKGRQEEKGRFEEEEETWNTYASCWSCRGRRGDWRSRTSRSTGRIGSEAGDPPAGTSRPRGRQPCKGVRYHFPLDLRALPCFPSSPEGLASFCLHLGCRSAGLWWLTGKRVAWQRETRLFNRCSLSMFFFFFFLFSFLFTRFSVLFSFKNSFYLLSFLWFVFFQIFFLSFFLFSFPFSEWIRFDRPEFLSLCVSRQLRKRLPTCVPIQRKRSCFYLFCTSIPSYKMNYKQEYLLIFLLLALLVNLPFLILMDCIFHF